MRNYDIGEALAIMVTGDLYISCDKHYNAQNNMNNGAVGVSVFDLIDKYHREKQRRKDGDVVASLKRRHEKLYIKAHKR